MAGRLKWCSARSSSRLKFPAAFALWCAACTEVLAILARGLAATVLALIALPMLRTRNRLKPRASFTSNMCCLASRYAENADSYSASSSVAPSSQQSVASAPATKA